MPNPTDKACSNCVHGFMGEEGLTCRRYPPMTLGAAVTRPSIVPGGPPRLERNRMSVWPAVQADFVCGEYSRRLQAIEPSLN